MKNNVAGLFRIMFLCGTSLLMTSCWYFHAREVEMDKRSEHDSMDYYRFSAGGGEQLSFASRNYLSSNLLMDDFRGDGKN